MRRFSVWLVFLLFSLSVSRLAFAQDPYEQIVFLEGWDVGGGCIPEPTLPPGDFAFDGTILMSGYAGIHANNHDWDTPRVASFFTPDAEGNTHFPGGQMSPDGAWYAVLIGGLSPIVEFSNNLYWFNETLRVYNAHNNREYIEIEFNEVIGLPSRYWIIEWQSNESLIVGDKLIYPLEARIENSPFETEYIGLSLQEPDLKVEDRSLTVNDSLLRGVPAWKHDRTGFIAASSKGVGYFDSNRNLVETIMELDDEGVYIERGPSGRSDLYWSPDGRYFALRYNESRHRPLDIFVIDFENRTIIDTCIAPASNVVWSPDSTQFAYFDRATENLRLIVVDIDLRLPYEVARHSNQNYGGYIGGIEMMGWRED